MSHQPRSLSTYNICQCEVSLERYQHLFCHKCLHNNTKEDLKATIQGSRGVCQRYISDEIIRKRLSKEQTQIYDTLSHSAAFSACRKCLTKSCTSYLIMGDYDLVLLCDYCNPPNCVKCPKNHPTNFKNLWINGNGIDDAVNEPTRRCTREESEEKSKSDDFIEYQETLQCPRCCNSILSKSEIESMNCFHQFFRTPVCNGTFICSICKHENVLECEEVHEEPKCNNGPRMRDSRHGSISKQRNDKIEDWNRLQRCGEYFINEHELLERKSFSNNLGEVESVDSGIYQNSTGNDSSVFESTNSRLLSEINIHNVYLKMEKRDTRCIKQTTIDGITESVQNLDYTIQTYNKIVRPLQACREELNSSYPPISENDDIDSDIFYCAKLREESEHCGGVEVDILKEDILGMRVIQRHSALWVTNPPVIKGMKNQFHIGDKIISVEHKDVTELGTFKKIIHSVHLHHKLKFRLQRFPEGRIFCVKVEDAESIFHLGDDWTVSEFCGVSIDVDGQQAIQEKMNNLLNTYQGHYLPVLINSSKFLHGLFESHSDN